MTGKAGRAVIAFAVAVVAVLSTGCTARAQMAYSIQDVGTSVKQVSAVMLSCQKATKDTAYVESAQWTVNAMLRADLAKLAAADKNIAYDNNALLQLLTSGDLGGQGQAMTKDPLCSDLAVGLALDALVSTQLGVSTYAEHIKTYKLVVNPRFGTWNPSTGTLDGSGSLSQASSVK